MEFCASETHHKSNIRSLQGVRAATCQRVTAEQSVKLRLQRLGRVSRDPHYLRQRLGVGIHYFSDGGGERAHCFTECARGADVLFLDGGHEGIDQQGIRLPNLKRNPLPCCALACLILSQRDVLVVSTKARHRVNRARHGKRQSRQGQRFGFKSLSRSHLLNCRFENTNSLGECVSPAIMPNVRHDAAAKQTAGLRHLPRKGVSDV